MSLVEERVEAAVLLVQSVAEWEAVFLALAEQEVQTEKE